jgi:hypothetical protein
MIGITHSAAPCIFLSYRRDEASPRRTRVARRARGRRCRGLAGRRTNRPIWRFCRANHSTAPPSLPSSNCRSTSMLSSRYAICSLVAKPSNFDRQPVTFQGIATAVKKTTSRRGNDYTLFKLQGPGGCGTVDVFMWGHPKLSNGDHVRVEGVFESVHHQDRSVFYNQVEATKVVPVQK